MWTKKNRCGNCVTQSATSQPALRTHAGISADVRRRRGYVRAQCVRARYVHGRSACGRVRAWRRAYSRWCVSAQAGVLNCVHAGVRIRVSACARVQVPMRASARGRRARECARAGVQARVPRYGCTSARAHVRASEAHARTAERAGTGVRGASAYVRSVQRGHARTDARAGRTRGTRARGTHVQAHTRECAHT